MNNITIELCKEDRARLDRIAELLEAQTAGSVKPAAKKPENKPTAPEKVETQPSAQPVKEEPKQPEKAAPEEAPSVQLADIQNLVVSLAAKGRKADVREIVLQYSERVTTIPASKYAEVFEKLKKLEG